MIAVLTRLGELVVDVLRSFVMFVATNGRPANVLGLTTSLRKMMIISCPSGTPTTWGS